MIPNIIFIILIGAITSYTDLKKRIIQNKVILIGLVVAPFLHILSLVQNPALVSLVPPMINNLLFAIFTGILLWHVHIWPAGDGKLFIAYTFLLPLDIYQVTKSFISFDFLINTFVPVFLVMLLILLTKSKKSDIKKSLKVAFDPYNLVLALIVIIGFLWVLFEVMGGFGISHNYLIAMVLLFVIVVILTKVVPFNLEYLYIFLAVARIFIDYRTVFTFGYAYYLITLLLSFLVLRYFVIELAFKKYTVKKKIENLKPGICLAEGIVEKRHGKTVKYEKERIKQFTIVQSMSDRAEKKFIHNISFDGLTKKDVDKIKMLKKKGKIKFNYVLTHIITPFALFLFIGILITLFLRTNFALYIRMLLLG